MTDPAKSSSINLLLSWHNFPSVFHISQVHHQNDLIPWAEDPWWIFENAQDWAQFAAYCDYSTKKKKWSKRKKKLKIPDMKYCWHNLPLCPHPQATQPPKQNWIQIQCCPCSHHPDPLVPAIKDSPGIWSISSNDTVIYGTLPSPVLVKPLFHPRYNWYCGLPVEDTWLWAFTRGMSPVFGPLKRSISQMTWPISQPASRPITFPFP
jgi:hypothetical protein